MASFLSQLLMKVVALSSITLLFSLILLAVPSPKAEAAYQAGRLIDDGLFLDAKSMSASEIQNFLVSKNSGLKNMNFTLSCYGADSTERKLYTAAGAKCDTPIPASEIIYYAAQIYGVSPKVILATMQKEQSLTTAPNPTIWQLTQAMGYACPTSGSCDSSSSFPYQIDSGTWVLRYHYERARGNMSWWSQSSTWTCGSAKPSYYTPNLYPKQNVNFVDPYSGIQYTTVYIENAATSAFYCYTPHVFNNHTNSPHPQEPKGSSRCYSGHPAMGDRGRCYTGSYNFVLFYELWFGSAQIVNLPGCPESINTTVDCVWKLRSVANNEQHLLASIGDRNAMVNEGGFVFEGTYFHANSVKAPKTWNVPVYRLTKPNGSNFLTASEAEKNTLVANGFRLNGVDFYANPPSETSNAGYSIYRLYSASSGEHVWVSSLSQRNDYLKRGYSYEGIAFQSLTVKNQEKPPLPNMNNVYRFYLQSTKSHFYTTNLSERESLISKGFTYEGVAWQSSASVTNKPVYRLYSQKLGRHLFTTDISERDSLVNSRQWSSEGISQYASQTSNNKPVYRLYSPSLNSHFWTSDINERNHLANRSGYIPEGVAWYQP